MQAGAPVPNNGRDEGSYCQWEFSLKFRNEWPKTSTVGRGEGKVRWRSFASSDKWVKHYNLAGSLSWLHTKWSFSSVFSVVTKKPNPASRSTLWVTTLKMACYKTAISLKAEQHRSDLDTVWGFSSDGKEEEGFSLWCWFRVSWVFALHKSRYQTCCLSPLLGPLQRLSIMLNIKPSILPALRAATLSTYLPHTNQLYFWNCCTETNS